MRGFIGVGREWEVCLVGLSIRERETESKIRNILSKFSALHYHTTFAFDSSFESECLIVHIVLSHADRNCHTSSAPEPSVSGIPA